MVCKDPEWTQLAQDGLVVGSWQSNNEAMDSTEGKGGGLLKFLDYRLLFHGNDYVVNNSAAPRGLRRSGGRHPRMLDNGTRWRRSSSTNGPNPMKEHLVARG